MGGLVAGRKRPAYGLGVSMSCRRRPLGPASESLMLGVAIRTDSATDAATDSVSPGLLGRRGRRGVPASHEQRGRAEGGRIVCEYAARAPAASI